ncbi:MAG: endonuclease III [Clostridia bacterium]
MQDDHHAEILQELARLYPDAKPELHFTNPYETLVATILSAQCTDRQVNKVTAKLFVLFPDVAQMAALTPQELEPHIKQCGFYHTKAQHIVDACQTILSKYAGQIPDTMEALMELPGVGRKTANVVMANAFGADAIAVDTHVQRVSNRLGLAHAAQPLHTEQQLREAIPQADWSKAHHWLIYHGRRVCAARNPACTRCTLCAWCVYYAAQQAPKAE